MTNRVSYDGPSINAIKSIYSLAENPLPTPTKGAEAEAASGAVEPSETDRRWVAPPAALGTSYRQTRDQRPNHPCLAHSGCGCRRSLGRRDSGRTVLVVVLILLVVLAVVPVTELNRPDITAARPDFPDIDPAPPQLIGGQTGGIVARINRLTGGQQREVAIARRAVICKGAQAGVPSEVRRLEGNGAVGRIANQVRTQRRHRADTIRHKRPLPPPTAVAGENGIHENGGSDYPAPGAAGNIVRYSSIINYY
jgi:hypothetical protein